MADESHNKSGMREPFEYAAGGAVTGIQDLLYRDVPEDPTFESFFEHNQDWLNETAINMNALDNNLEIMALEVMTAAHGAGRQDIVDSINLEWDRTVHKDMNSEVFLTPQAYIVHLNSRIEANGQLAEKIQALANELPSAKTDLYKEAEGHNQGIFENLRQASQDAMDVLEQEGLIREARNDTLSAPADSHKIT